MFYVFLRKVVIVSEYLNRNRALIPDCWRSYRESTFANIELSFRSKGCSETDGLSVLDMY